MDRKLILLSLVAAVIGLTSGCASNRLGEKMASWQGSHIDGVVSEWGPADSCIEQYGQTVCRWTDNNLMIDNATSSFPLGAVSRPQCTRMLAVDESGLITGWQWRGNNCDLSGQHVMARNETGRPSAVAADFNLADDSSASTARK